MISLIVSLAVDISPRSAAILKHELFASISLTGYCVEWPESNGQMECRFVRQRTRDIEFCGKTLQNAVFFYDTPSLLGVALRLWASILTHVRRPVPGLQECKKGKL